MADYLLGIDNGSTVSKAAIFDLQGREVQVASCKVEPDYPHPGWTERSMDLLWRKTAEAVREAITTSGIDPARIMGIGATGHGNGLYLLDREGRPARAGIQSMDTRAAAVIQEWNNRDLHSRVFPQTLQSFWAAQPNALLVWIKRHEPHVYERISAVLMCKDFINHCLTGEIRTDFTDMSATSLLDGPKRRYSETLLEAYDLFEMRHALPPLANSFEVIGRVTRDASAATGLVQGTPVVAGLFDVDAAALGSGVYMPGQVCIVAGTWSINEIVTAEPLVDPALFMTTLYTIPGLWLTVEASPTSAANLEWFVTQFCDRERTEAAARGVSVYEICSEMVESLPPGGTDIIFHPFLYGSNVQPSARAGFYGIAGWHTKAHLVRALYEGIVYCHLDHIENLRRAGAIAESARITGGGSRSVVWTQMFADALQVPIEVPNGSEIGARGAAMCAGIGIGAYRDHADAVNHAVTLQRRQEPNPEATPSYLARFAEYRRLAEAMQDPWNHLNKLSS